MILELWLKTATDSSARLKCISTEKKFTAKVINKDTYMRASGPMLRLTATLSTPWDMKILETPGPSSLNLLRLEMLTLESTACVPLKSSVSEEARPKRFLLNKRVVSPLSTVVIIWIKMASHLLRYAEPT